MSSRSCPRASGASLPQRRCRVRCRRCRTPARPGRNAAQDLREFRIAQPLAGPLRTAVGAEEVGFAVGLEASSGSCAISVPSRGEISNPSRLRGSPVQKLWPRRATVLPVQGFEQAHQAGHADRCARADRIPIASARPSRSGSARGCGGGRRFAAVQRAACAGRRHTRARSPRASPRIAFDQRERELLAIAASTRSAGLEYAVPGLCRERMRRDDHEALRVDRGFRTVPDEAPGGRPGIARLRERLRRATASRTSAAACALRTISDAGS